MVQLATRSISISGGRLPESGRRVFWCPPPLFLSFHPMVVQYADVHAGNDRRLLLFLVVTRAHSKRQIALGGGWGRDPVDRVNCAIRVLRISTISNSPDLSRAFFHRWGFDRQSESDSDQTIRALAGLCFDN